MGAPRPLTNIKGRTMQNIWDALIGRTALGIRVVTEEPKKHEGMSADQRGAEILADTLKTLLKWQVEIVKYKDSYYVIRT